MSDSRRKDISPRLNQKADLTEVCFKFLTFWIVLGVFCVLTLAIPLRPAYSEKEKRDLEKFPAFSLSSLANGSYFRSIDSWFADTFPFRDFFMSANTQLKEAYGIKTVEVHGNVTPGDDIPPPPDGYVDD